jgi:hypothetical protein
VEKFWAKERDDNPASQELSRKHAETLAKWREDLRADRMPQGFQWLLPTSRQQP